VGSTIEGLGGQPQNRLTSEQLRDVYGLLLSPRALLAYGLVQVNPAAAHAFADDSEVDARQDRVYAATRPGLHCPGNVSVRPLTGVGFYAATVPQSMAAPAEPDILPRLTGSLREASVDALVIKAQCDYLDWESATSYLRAFDGSRLAYVRGDGHDMQAERPADVLAAVRAFLRGSEPPGLLGAPFRQPADYQPALSTPTRTNRTARS
jgi:proline iminopeptidase